MVYLSPPHLASALRPSYAQAYNTILATHRRSPLTSASSVIILVAPDVDALCAARMLADLFKQDDVMHRIIPVSGIAEMERMRDELATYADVSTHVAHGRPVHDVSSIAAHADPPQYGRHLGPHLRRVVWRIPRQALCARHRLYATSEPGQPLRRRRGCRPCHRLG
jgi:hypothetical protein